MSLKSRTGTKKLLLMSGLEQIRTLDCAITTSGMIPGEPGSSQRVLLSKYWNWSGKIKFEDLAAVQRGSDRRRDRYEL